MIELIYNEEEGGTVDEASLPEPKNVKQVGEPREYKKIFIEDYVHTFLLQYSEGKDYRMKIALLLGSRERAGGKRHLYIKSAIPAEGVTEKQGKYCFSEKLWSDLYQECEKYFPGQEIMGWFLARPGFPVEKNALTEETHRTYFSGADKVLFMLEPLEGESGFFGFDGNRFERQSGYYIYYEKNEPMREYMLENRPEQKKAMSKERPDVAMENFRKILQEKQEQSEKRKKLVLSYGTRIALLLVFFVGAVILKNQTDQIRRMEKQTNGSLNALQTQETAGDEVIVEELPGNVEEQPEAAEEAQNIPITEAEDTPEEVQPEELEEQPEEQPEEIPEKPQEQESAQEAAATPPVYEEYTIQVGDTLAKISRERYGNDEMVDEICALNEIENGDYIQVGETILLP